MTRASAVVFCVIVTATALAQPAPASRSQVAVVQEGGGRVDLQHVRGARYKPASGEAEIRLLFTSADPGDIAVADAFGSDAVTAWVRKSGASAVQVSFPEANPEQFQVNFVNINGRSISGGGTSSGGETRGVFKKIEMAGERVSGELMHKTGDLSLSGTFEVRASSVSAAASITGAAVARSPQGQALLAFARALSKEDLMAAQAHAAGDVKGELEEMKKMLGPNAIKELVKEQFGDMAAFTRRLGSPEASLQESGDAAKISLVRKTKEASGESTETTSFRFVRVDGQWKIQM